MSKPFTPAKAGVTLIFTMSMVARHKKKGGFRKLVNSLETTPLDKRIKIIEMMRAEDPEFIKEVEACIFNFEEWVKLNDLVVAEFLGGFNEMKTLAVALYKSPDTALVDKFVKNLQGRQIFEFKEQTEMIRGVVQREQLAARFRIIEKAREMEANRKFVLKKYSEKFHNYDD